MLTRISRPALARSSVLAVIVAAALSPGCRCDRAEHAAKPPGEATAPAFPQDATELAAVQAAPEAPVAETVEAFQRRSAPDEPVGASALLIKTKEEVPAMLQRYIDHSGGERAQKAALAATLTRTLVTSAGSYQDTVVWRGPDRFATSGNDHIGGTILAGGKCHVVFGGHSAPCNGNRAGFTEAMRIVYAVVGGLGLRDKSFAFRDLTLGQFGEKSTNVLEFEVGPSKLKVFVLYHPEAVRPAQIRVRAETGPAFITVNLSDWKKMGGVFVPVLRQYVYGEEVVLEEQIQGVELGADDKAFKVPPAVTDTPIAFGARGPLLVATASIASHDGLGDELQKLAETVGGVARAGFAFDAEAFLEPSESATEITRNLEAWTPAASKARKADAVVSTRAVELGPKTAYKFAAVELSKVPDAAAAFVKAAAAAGKPVRGPVVARYLVEPTADSKRVVVELLAALKD